MPRSKKHAARKYKKSHSKKGRKGADKFGPYISMPKGSMNSGLFRVLRFFILFNLFSLPMHIMLAYNFSFPPVQKITADLVLFSLNAAGTGAELDGLLLIVPSPGGDFAGFMEWDCTGWKSIIAFLALVLATEENARKKMNSLVFLPLIYAINIFRVSAVFWLVSIYGSEYFSVIHSFFFGFFMITAILALWFVWFRYFKNEIPWKTEWKMN